MWHQTGASVQRIVQWLGRHELSTLVAMGLMAGGLWAFMAIAGEVKEGETDAIDRALLLAARNPNDLSDPIGPRWVEEMARDVTALGGITVLTLVTLSVVGYLLLERKSRAAIVVIVAVVGGLAVSHALKWQVGRPRPDLVPHGSYVSSASFPSGHAMMSAATYFTLGALLARVHDQRRLKAYFLILAAFLSVAVGISRVYLGVHWPSDVLAGWALGACWAVLCWLIARRLQRTGEMEKIADS
ncbi:MAG: phosphatase PAP2 family protein [Planctomycetaceae bacterium]|nr:phosphatase PAP2 family protein [Planctomycetaceae bacterium]